MVGYAKYSDEFKKAIVEKYLSNPEKRKLIGRTALNRISCQGIDGRWKGDHEKNRVNLQSDDLSPHLIRENDNVPLTLNNEYRVQECILSQWEI